MIYSGRVLLSQSYYHIMTRGNNRQAVFRAPDDYRFFLDRVDQYKKNHPFNLFHYCLMPNHTHWLIQTKSEVDFAAFMKKINLSYCRYFQRRYKLIGHLWQGRYKSQSVGKDAYFIQCGKYIELNPARARIVDDPNSYKFSSYRYYTRGEKNPLISRDIFFDELGETEEQKQARYQDLAIDDLVVSTYLKREWGTPYQAYQERKKAGYYYEKKWKRKEQ